ncbi:MAG: CAP domain-containing protein, partial [Spirochaetaceae bacterium]|nr:CAP domain-containing protein [Spirochaetaceae bacterium]
AAASPPPAAAATPAAAGAASLAGGATSVGPAFLSQVEAEIVAELNLARSAPSEYAAFLREYRSYIRGKLYEQPGKIAISLNEGAKAVDEAIAFLEKQKPLGVLTASKGMSRAAKDLAAEQGRTGATGHSSADGSSPFDRMERYGDWKRTAGENCAYGGETGREIVIQLIVDDGVPSRGHRANIFNPDFAVVGVAVGPHPGYRVVCVQDFAGGYSDK